MVTEMRDCWRFSFDTHAERDAMIAVLDKHHIAYDLSLETDANHNRVRYRGERNGFVHYFATAEVMEEVHTARRNAPDEPEPQHADAPADIAELPVRRDGLAFGDVCEWLSAQPAAQAYQDTPMLAWSVCGVLELTWLDLPEITLVESEIMGEQDDAFYVPVAEYDTLRLRTTLSQADVVARIRERSALYGIELDDQVQQEP